MLGEQGLIDRDQFVRLIVESLHSLSYTASADVLEGESGIARLSLGYHQLRNLIFSGQWEDCVKTIETKELFKDLEPERRCGACFLIWQPCFLEQLASQDTDAIPILRHRIAPLAYGHREVHSLALSIITPDPSHKRELIQRRGELFKDVARNMPTWVRIPQRRLKRLVEMASIQQQVACPYHNNDSALPAPCLPTPSCGQLRRSTLGGRHSTFSTSFGRRLSHLQLLRSRPRPSPTTLSPCFSAPPQLWTIASGFFRPLPCRPQSCRPQLSPLLQHEQPSNTSSPPARALPALDQLRPRPHASLRLPAYRPGFAPMPPYDGPSSIPAASSSWLCPSFL